MRVQFEYVRGNQWHFGGHARRSGPQKGYDTVLSTT
jgi:hypothetical protein